MRSTDTAYQGNYFGILTIFIYINVLEVLVCSHNIFFLERTWNGPLIMDQINNSFDRKNYEKLSDFLEIITWFILYLFENYFAKIYDKNYKESDEFTYKWLFARIQRILKGSSLLKKVKT